MKVWIISFCVVAGITAGVLVWTGDNKSSSPSGSTTGSTAGSTAGPGGIVAIQQTLDLQSIEKYLTVQPELDQVFLAAARSGGKQNTKAKVYAVLQSHGLDGPSWSIVRRRVEEVVVALRLEAEMPRELAKLERRIELKQEAHDLAKGKLKEQLAMDIELLKQLRDNTKITMHDSDRELARRYWKALDQLVPQIRPG